MTDSTSWDRSLDWFWEGNVQERIIDYMLNVEKFEILIKSNTFKKTRGPDILARKDDLLRQVSVKGYPSDKYTTDFPGGKKGEKKKTRPATQARHWFSEALLELILAKSDREHLEIALGFPKFQTYLSLLNKIKFFREKIGLYCYLVSQNGQVRLVLPREDFDESTIKNTVDASFFSKAKRLLMLHRRHKDSPIVNYRQQKEGIPESYTSFEQIIKKQQPTVSLKNIQIYDLTKTTSGVLRAYVYLDELKKSYTLLPEGNVKKCMNKLIDHIFNQFRESASVSECFEACNASHDTFIATIALLYKQGIISSRSYSGKIYLKLRRGYNYLKALGFDIQKRRSPIRHKPLHGPIEIMESKHKRIFDAIAEEERKRRQALRES